MKGLLPSGSAVHQEQGARPAAAPAAPRNTHTWLLTSAHLIPLSPHEQDAENVQHLQLIHNLVHDLHGLRELSP